MATKQKAASALSSTEFDAYECRRKAVAAAHPEHASTAIYVDGAGNRSCARCAAPITFLDGWKHG